MTCRLLVVTDLDGSLLDHHSYSYAAAIPALEALKARHVPLILNSSKTAAEIRRLRQALGNHSPYVVENGAGIYLPAGAQDGPEPGGRDKLLSFGMNRAEVLHILHDLRKKHDYRFQGFADMTVADLVRHTGLAPEEAAQALERDFSEPLLWDDSPARFQAFCASLEEKGLRAVKGGRFVHVAAPADKGEALNWLRDYYGRGCDSRPRVMALGDGDNDISMLEAADYPVVIKSPVNRAPVVHNAHVIYTGLEGPEGWNEAVLARLRAMSPEQEYH